jgi:pyruvate/2-oxoglutarate dehydrogenase complex dihydrolipoamide dehydrogenase (E3) component
MERVRQLRAQISPHDSARRYQQLGVDVFLGQGKFIGPQSVEVDGKVLKFSKAVIATGARAVVLPIKGLAEAGCLTNETVFSLTQLPGRLAVIGAGPIGCEMAQAFRRFGSEVVVLEAECKILPREDRDAAEIVERALRRDGITVRCDCKILEVRKEERGKVIYVESHGAKLELPVNEILLGVGRAPNIEGLNLEAAGVEYSNQGVKVNDCLQTSNARIYAAGDICLPYKFTHTADATARIVIQNALFAGRKKMSALVIPWCTYTDPEIAHVGLYETQAKEKGVPVQTFTQAFDEVDRALLEGETGGLIKVHVRQGTDKILGATIVARHAGEMISEITLAMTGNIRLKTIAQTIHPYPTQAEAIKKVADAYNRTRLTPAAKKLFTRWLGWKR